MRRSAEFLVIGAAVVLLAAALLGRLYSRGGPYFARPLTIVDHTGPIKHDTADALHLLPRVEPLLPRGATVTCFRPHDGEQQFDMANYFAAVGGLPHQQVWPPFTASRDMKCKDVVDYVVAVGSPFVHPCFAQIAEFPEGRLYQAVR
jgi:hypothetical protein